ncbi:MAG: alpha/beta hydrolase [Anaerolineales bacterium]|nr:alpha/beta hydrolase [Anaerolineales bacterium]
MEALQPGEYDAQINGIKIHYSIRGSGPVIMAHSGGPGADARSWGDFAGIGEFATIVSIHPRGSGLSENSPDNAYALSDYAADLEALRVLLDLEKPTILGWSHGGIVAQQYAFTYPDALSKLILFDTAAYLAEFIGDIEASVRAYEHEPWFSDSFAALQKEWNGEYETDEDMSALWAEMMKFYFREFDERAVAYHEATKDYKMRIDSLRQFNEFAETMDLRPMIRNISVPTLVIAGRHDFITTVDMAEEMVRHIPGARLEIFEQSGHFALVEEPGKFNQVIRDFVLS